MPERDSIAVGAVVVAYNSEPTLTECLRSLCDDEAVASVVVVDNSSSPATKRLVEEFDDPRDRLTYLDPGANLGFAAGCNSGARAVGTVTHLAFVNPDVRLTRSLRELAASLTDSSSAIIAGLLQSPVSGVASNTRDLPSWGREFAKAVLGSRAYVGSSVQPSDSSAPREVGQVDGALLVTSAAIFEELEGFDERFELYYEDVDLCARAHAIGAVSVVPRAWGDHIGGASSASASATSYCVGRISRLRYFRKVYGDTFAVRAALRLLGLVEFAARSVTRQGEGSHARWASVRQQAAELRSPGSVRLLR